MIDFLSKIEILLFEYVKTVKIPGFFKTSKIPGKKTTLLYL